MQSATRSQLLLVATVLARRYHTTLYRLGKVNLKVNFNLNNASTEFVLAYWSECLAHGTLSRSMVHVHGRTTGS